MAKRVIISGGGTGGHIFPAISIANALKERMPDCKILFVGAEGRMEMEKVPAAGYDIVGLPVAGFQRKISLQVFSFFGKLAKSMWKARKVVKSFKPDAAVGVGGYASGPVLRVAASRGVPTLLQEQNSFAGVTNKILAQNAARICVAYDGMERFFEESKIVLTGNPVRQDLLKPVDKNEAYAYFGLKPEFKTLLIVGGSLGARSINNAIANGLNLLAESGIQVICQTGKLYFDEMHSKAAPFGDDHIKTMAFVSRMDYAYAIADLVVSRAGAGTISELCLLAKASLLVPSPNVAEDHQTKNAKALVDKKAAQMMRDTEAFENLVPEALHLIASDDACAALSANALAMAQHNSAERIVDELIKIMR